MTYAVLLAGGIGSRVGANIPKQFIKINNKPLIVYCIEKFILLNEFKKIIVSSPKEYISQTKEFIDEFLPNEDRIVIIEGGETRQDTLLNSIYYIDKIKDCDNPIVVCHDAARIFVSEKLIKNCIDYTRKYGSSSPVVSTTDVIVEMENKTVTRMPNRYNLVHVQTPQGFKLTEYKNLFEKLSDDEKSDVHEIIKVYYLNNKEVYIFNGEKSNFKITTPFDIELAEFILKE